jgi:hypothetical protein
MPEAVKHEPDCFASRLPWKEEAKDWWNKYCGIARTEIVS